MLIFLAGIALLLPGLCWWIWFGHRDNDPLEILGNIVGVSISITAIIALLFFLVKVPIHLFTLLIGSLIWFGLCIWGVIKKRDIKISWTWLAVLAVFSILVIWRLYQARMLVLPAWVDSLHHVLIIRKFIDFGGLPGDLSPYLEVQFYYHYAFHTLTAKFAVLSQLSIEQAVLILGQVLNAAIGLSVYSLGKAIFKDWRPASLAAIFVSFLTLMPGYYLAWGRYTLTTGMVLLPLAMTTAIKMLRRDRKPGDWIGMTLLTAGTFLAHYFTAILLAIFLVILGIGHLVNNRKDRKLAINPLIYLTLSVLAGVIMVLPWLWRVFIYSKMSIGISVSLPAEMHGLIANQDQWQYLWYLLGSKAGHLLIYLSLPALVLAFLKQSTRVIGVWGFILGLLAFPWGLRIDGLRPDHFAIVLFLPLALLVATLIMALVNLIEKVSKREWVSWILIGFVMLGSIIWGTVGNWDKVNGKTILASEADVKAIEWIKTNTPEDARFFINTTSWGYDISRGVDGGAWILPLTGRWTIAPTLFYAFGQDQDQIQQISGRGTKAQEITGCNEAFWQLVDEASLTHIYIKDNDGSLNSKALSGCAGVKKVYDVDGVSVWELSFPTP
ncbi:MAG: glycosyltransferase family 39 protein [Anaerolineaceae bacterium]|nr:glycosyltransferase family 39 protein [Anaerolineaceae bacterium]